MKLSIFFGLCGLSAGLVAGCGSTSDTPGSNPDAAVSGTGASTGTGGTVGSSGSTGTGATTATGGLTGTGATVGNGGTGPGTGGNGPLPDGGRRPGTCAANTDCMGRRSAGPVCDTATGQCVQCLAAGDCNNGETCNVTAHRCVQSCGAGADAGGRCSARNGTPICNAALGYCVQCAASSDCTTSRTRRQCLADTGRCVECLTTADCGDSGVCAADHTCGG
jgi:hypothetical protein